MKPHLTIIKNEVWGKVIFSVACVKNSVHRGGSTSVHAGIPPPPRALRSACWAIRSTSGRYASYWNAILLLVMSDGNNQKLFTLAFGHCKCILAGMSRRLTSFLRSALFLCQSTRPNLTLHQFPFIGARNSIS